MSTGAEQPEGPSSGEVFHFALVLDEPLDEHIQTLPAAGCRNASFGSAEGVPYVELDWRASSFAEALASAIIATEECGVLVRRVEPDDLVTATEIAERLGRSRESVRLLASGARGGGGFPPPVSHLRERQRLWRWSEVAAWSGDLGPEECDRARIVAVVNAALEYRRHSDAATAFVRALIGDSGGGSYDADLPSGTAGANPPETTFDGFRPDRPAPYWSRPQ